MPEGLEVADVIRRFGADWRAAQGNHLDRRRRRVAQAKVSLINQVWGLLRPFGLVVRPNRGQSFAERVAELAAGNEILTVVTDMLVPAIADLEKRIDVLDKQVRLQGRGMAEVHRFMTTPNIGPITALAFRTVIDDPGPGDCRLDVAEDGVDPLEGRVLGSGTA